MLVIIPQFRQRAVHATTLLLASISDSHTEQTHHADSEPVDETSRSALAVDSLADFLFFLTL